MGSLDVWGNGEGDVDGDVNGAMSGTPLRQPPGSLTALLYPIPSPTRMIGSLVLSSKCI